MPIDALILIGAMIGGFMLAGRWLENIFLQLLLGAVLGVAILVGVGCVIGGILFATGYDLAFIPRGGRMLVGLDGALVGACFALPLCLVAGWILTKPQPRGYVRAGWFLLLSAAVIAVNFALAFAGCVVVMP